MNRSQRRRLRTRAALLAAIRAELATSSVEDMVVHDVTERADVALGTFYNHFDDKAAGVAALAELESAMIRRLTEEATNPSDDIVRRACTMVTLTVHRAAAEPAWINAMRALVDAQAWPTAVGRAYVADAVLHSGNLSDSDVAWTAEVFHSICRGLIRHLAGTGFEGSLSSRIERAVSSMCGALLADEATTAAHLEVCTKITVRTDWPDATVDLVDDETFAEGLRSMGAGAASVVDA